MTSPTTASPSPTQVSIPQTPLTPAQAWGNVHIAQFPATFGTTYFNAGGSYGENTVTDDDQICGNTESAYTNLTPQQLLQEVQTIALMNLHTGQLTTIHTMPAGYQGLSCAATGNWIIWIEAYGATYESFQAHWKILAYNRQTQELRLLDQSQSTPSPAPPYPSASNGYVAWTQVYDGNGDTQVVLYNLATDQKTVLAQNASFPQLSWPWVSWGDAAQQGIVFEHLTTHQQVVLQQKPTTSAFNGTSFVVSNNDYTTITLYPSITSSDQLNTNYVVGQSINQDFVQYPTLNNRLVTWDSNYSLFAFDRKLLRLVQIPGIFGNPHPTISGHYMIWGQPISPADLQASMHGSPLHVILYALDTNQLP